MKKNVERAKRESAERGYGRDDTFWEEIDSWAVEGEYIPPGVALCGNRKLYAEERAHAGSLIPQAREILSRCQK